MYALQLQKLLAVAALFAPPAPPRMMQATAHEVHVIAWRDLSEEEKQEVLWQWCASLYEYVTRPARLVMLHVRQWRQYARRFTCWLLAEGE